MTIDDCKIVLYRNEPEGWVAEIPAIPGCYAPMITKAEALAELELVFEMVREVYQERGRPLPAETTEFVHA